MQAHTGSAYLFCILPKATSSRRGLSQASGPGLQYEHRSYSDQAAEEPIRAEPYSKSDCRASAILGTSHQDTDPSR